MIKLMDPHSIIQYASGYTLDLYCDHENGEHGFSEFPHQFLGETFRECAHSARKRGWVIHEKPRTGTCPRCSVALKEMRNAR
jgi:hypothetical protein